MMAPGCRWLGRAAAAIAILIRVDGALARIDPCPARCSTSGPNSGNWSAYPNFSKLNRCQETMFYDFALHDPVDNRDLDHRILACSSYGPDFADMPSSEVSVASADFVDVEYEVGSLEDNADGPGLAASAIRSLVQQLRLYLDNGHGPTDDRPLIMFAQFGAATMGLYVGEALQKEGLSSYGLDIFEDHLTSNSTSSSPSVAMQLCEPGFDSTHVFGVVALSNASFNPIQEAIKSWSKATCLPLVESTKIPSQALFTAPLEDTTESPGNPTGGNSTAFSNRSQIGTAATGRRRSPTPLPLEVSHARLHVRAECKTVQVASGDSCAALAKKCGISGGDFTKYNSGSDFCAKLVPKQHVCCSKGDLPDFRPKKNADGSCFSYQVRTGDNCGDIAAANGLKMSDLENFNKKTWGWNGCKRLLIDTVMCVSEGDPPFPAPMANAVCGPQKPGSKKPTGGAKIADLNPCPLNACCNIWGQCGITEEFCVDTSTGAPGTAKAGTNGCISNCGTDIVKGNGDGSQRIAYFQGYGLARKCLFQDATQIDTKQYTHVHFGFATLTSDFKVETGDVLSSFEFQQFKRIRGAKRIISFGGWDFSTKPATYSIFRQGVTPANRLTLANSIASFVNRHGLDGVDIDWEYPGAPDIPEIPPASKDDGANYLAFLTTLKGLLHDKSVSIAAPSSYWYLKQYPIASISKVIDYIVFMTYDLHGQWDSGNTHSQIGCDAGNCLRSQINLTETQTSLSMITKAGVAAEKVVVGITSYGRSFRMAVPGCHGPNCAFTGGEGKSDAAQGECTVTPGILANAEIADIIAGTQMGGIAARSGRVTADYVDPTSNSRILVYDDVQWVDFMDDSIKATRQALYKGWGFAGTTDWASDLQKYHPPPAPVKHWSIFKEMISNGENPTEDKSRTGNWTSYNCSDEHVHNVGVFPPSISWNAVNAYGAWQDAVRIWKETDRGQDLNFSASVARTFYVADGASQQCGLIEDGASCLTLQSCGQDQNGPLSGPGGLFVWNSLVRVKQMYTIYRRNVLDAATIVSFKIADFENTFAPVPPKEDNTWVDFIFDLISGGVGTIAGPVFKSWIKGFAYFKDAGDKVDSAAELLIDQGAGLAKMFAKKQSDGDRKWSPKDQAKFSAYVGQVIYAWTNITKFALEDIFDGSDASIEKLGNIIADGQLLDGKRGSVDFGTGDLLGSIMRTIFAFSIPALWRKSGAYVFVMDSGHSCSKSTSGFVDSDTQKATGFCMNANGEDRRYYLVQPKGFSKSCPCTPGNGACAPHCDSNTFSAPPGLTSLGDPTIGGITLEDLVVGSLNSYEANGFKNGGKFPDASDPANLIKLMSGGITAAGLIRLPVCSPARAFQSWDTSSPGSSDNYPCDFPPGIKDCGESTFINEVSGASPLVEDCKHMIANIQGDASTNWTTQVGVIGHNQRQILQYKSCAFGVEARELGNAVYYVGGQDVVNIVNAMIEKFPGERVGGQGDMKCKGNLDKVMTKVNWGLY